MLNKADAADPFVLERKVASANRSTQSFLARAGEGISMSWKVKIVLIPRPPLK